MGIAELEDGVRAAERRYERRVGEARSLAQQGKRAQQEAVGAEELAEACAEAVVFLNSFADERQARVQQRIEMLVTHGLQTIFGEEMSFHVQSEQKASRSEVSFSLRSSAGGVEIETPILDARGGGVAAVIGFLLRLIVKLLRRERPLLVLDESFGHVSAEYEPRLAEFIRELVDRTGVQIVLVTHSQAFSDAADVVYRFGQSKGQTVVTKETA